MQDTHAVHLINEIRNINTTLQAIRALIQEMADRQAANPQRQ